MKKLIDICNFSHDYDGFAFVENDCNCSICTKCRKYYFCCEDHEEVNYESRGTAHYEFPLTKEELNLTAKELCLKYCQSEWGKTYDIHNRQERFEDKTPVIDLIKQSEHNEK